MVQILENNNMLIMKTTYCLKWEASLLLHIHIHRHLDRDTKLLKNCSKTVQKLFKNCSKTVQKLFKNCSKTVQKLLHFYKLS